MEKEYLDRKANSSTTKHSFGSGLLGKNDKLYLGSDKDIEDARFLYSLFKKHLDINLINEFNQKLKTNELVIRYIK